VLITKSLWALGLTGAIEVPESSLSAAQPAMDDAAFYVQRHIDNHAATEERTTEHIANSVVASRENTFYWAKVVLVTFAIATVIMAVIGSVALSAKTLGLA
jgi:hypothetical protein